MEDKVVRQSKVKKPYGTKLEVLDRRREVWGLRSKGLSFRAIAIELEISPALAHRDCQKAELEWGECSTDPDVLREGLLTIHQQINGILMQNLLAQSQTGQVITESDKTGTKVTTKNWVSPQIAAEASRNLVRLANLMGLTDAQADGGAAQQSTVVMVTPPSDGGSFEAKYPAPVNVTSDSGDQKLPQDSTPPVS